jgi:hypothetical protein
MNASNLLRNGVILTLIGVAACSEVAPPVAPDARPTPTEPSLAKSAAPITDENVSVSPIFAQINARLAASRAKVRAVKAELLMDGKGWNGASSTIIIANDRARGIGSEWVKGDPRRGGRVGVTYAFGSNTSTPPETRDPDGSNRRFVLVSQLDAQIEEGMSAWRGLSCSRQPITRVAAGIDPDLLDQIFNGQAPTIDYAQPADIVQSGWQPLSFFTNFAGASGANIIGVAFTFIFGDDVNGVFVPSDIDRNGKDDTALAELYYNQQFYWGNNGARNVVDFYSIITHESGHALGLGHFGKVFVTKKAAADGIQIADIKYAPYAMMNAVYVTGRNELAGTDNSSFCQIWASK